MSAVFSEGGLGVQAQGPTRQDLLEAHGFIETKISAKAS